MTAGFGPLEKSPCRAAWVDGADFMANAILQLAQASGARTRWRRGRGRRVERPGAAGLESLVVFGISRSQAAAGPRPGALEGQWWWFGQLNGRAASWWWI